MTWRINDPQGNESGKVKYDIVPFTRGVVLDLGCGPFKAFPHFIGVDNGHHAKEFGWQFKPDFSVKTCESLNGVATLATWKRLGVKVNVEGEADDGAGDQVEYQAMIPDATCDAVFSSHLLEHINDTEGALTEWWRVLKPGGHLCLYLPHKLLYPNVGEAGANPDHKHDFMPAEITAFMLVVAAGFDLVVNEERAQDCEYSFLQVYRKRDDGVQDVALWERLDAERKAQKRVCVVRYGGIGDMIMASSILPQLKEQGYHVTLMTTPRGKEVVQADPHIDAFMVQDTDQVPNSWLAEYWYVWEKKFDRFINLSESVEANLLPLAGSSRHRWPAAMRAEFLDENYLEFTHKLAELPYQPRPRFYAAEDELARVKTFREGLPGVRLIMWVLSGSSPHKVYPHSDVAVAQLLLRHPNVRIVFVGDDACRILENQWEAEPRVIRLSGRIGVRETLALACHGVDCVVGPETGVLNAVSHLKVPKVVMLSHSSVRNLTRNWANTVSLTAPASEAPCYPCHQMHTDRTFCPDKKMHISELAQHLAVMEDWEKKVMEENTDDSGMFSTGAALCAHGIAPEKVVKAIMSSLPSRIVVPA